MASHLGAISAPFGNFEHVKGRPTRSPVAASTTYNSVVLSCATSSSFPSPIGSMPEASILLSSRSGSPVEVAASRNGIGSEACSTRNSSADATNDVMTAVRNARLLVKSMERMDYLTYFLGLQVR